MKARIKSLLRESGLYAFTHDSLPTGIDWLIDISRAGTIGTAPVCFDVGANVGQTVAELRARWPESRIHAFEPFAAPLEQLRAAVRGDGRVTVVPIAMGSRPQKMSVRPAANSVQNSLQGDAAEGRQGVTTVATGSGRDAAGGDRPAAETIEVDTLDAYCERHRIERIDVLKIDTEGWELEVLKGAAGLLAAGRISYVLAEVGLQAEDRQHTPFVDVLQWLGGRGMRLLGLYETYPLHFYPDPFTFCNALFAVAPLRHKGALRRRGLDDGEGEAAGTSP